jgi:Co/Zn/Cd efflux system component
MSPKTPAPEKRRFETLTAALVALTVPLVALTALLQAVSKFIEVVQHLGH